MGVWSHVESFAPTNAGKRTCRRISNHVSTRFFRGNPNRPQPSHKVRRIIDVKKIWVAHDCGRALNPVLVEGQMEGSAYMGYAEAFMEEQLFYEEGIPAGLHIGPSLLDYRIPTSEDTPELESLIVESFDPEGPYGAKEAGEGPLHPSIPAIANAVADAIGVRVFDLPITPEKVVRALNALPCL